MIRTEVATSGQLALLWMNGILFVRMTWMIRVCVINDSTNQPVWNNFSLPQQWNTYSITK